MKIFYLRLGAQIFISLYRHIIKPLLFRMDAEKAHHLTFAALQTFSHLPFSQQILKTLYSFEAPVLHRNFMGITFRNPVGMAAGLDKNALLFNQFSDMGFGFVEIGTVTPVAQAGNDKPRLFRLPKDRALINRMGFNNDGADIILQRLKNKKPGVVVGVNIGKNKITTNEDAIHDYIISYKKLLPVADYFVVNVSSPNTPGLRQLQDKEPLTKLLLALQTENFNAKKPILLKIAPDLSWQQIDDVIQIIYDTNLAGIVATNTTLSREGLLSPPYLCAQQGGLSGVPLQKKANDIVKFIAQKIESRFCLIGSGGIFTPDDARQRMDSGAQLIQLYTGFIYEGPSLIKQINKRLAQG